MLIIQIKKYILYTMSVPFIKDEYSMKENKYQFYYLSVRIALYNTVISRPNVVLPVADYWLD